MRAAVARKVALVALAWATAIVVSATLMMYSHFGFGRATQIGRLTASTIAVYGTWLAVRRTPRAFVAVTRRVRFAAWTMRVIGAVAALQLVSQVDMAFIAGRSVILVGAFLHRDWGEIGVWARAIYDTMTTLDLVTPFALVAAPVAAGVQGRRVLEGDDVTWLRNLALATAPSSLAAAAILRPGSGAPRTMFQMLNPLGFVLWSDEARPFVFVFEAVAVLASVAAYLALRAPAPNDGGGPTDDPVEAVYPNADVE